jgi:hypothetical protein
MLGYVNVKKLRQYRKRKLNTRHLPPVCITLSLEKILQTRKYAVEFTLQGIPLANGEHQYHFLFGSTKRTEADKFYKRYHRALKSGKYELVYDFEGNAELRI